MEQLRPDVQRLVDGLLDRVQDDGEMDVVGDVAAVLPAAVISKLLGVPAEDRVKFMAWSDTALGLQGNRRASLEVALRAQEAYVSLQEYFEALIEDRRRRPRDLAGGEEDLLTSLIRAGEEDDHLERAHLVQSCITLLMGGFETTTSLIANTVVLLLQHRDVLDRVRTEPALLGPTIEECLRIESPIQSVTRRGGGRHRDG